MKRMQFVYPIDQRGWNRDALGVQLLVDVRLDADGADMLEIAGPRRPFSNTKAGARRREIAKELFEIFRLLSAPH
jgi:hypothetical protein